MQTDTPIEKVAALVKPLSLDHATETQTNIRAKAAFQTAVKTQKTMLFVQRKTSPCVGIRWVTTFNITLFNPGPRRGFFFTSHLKESLRYDWRGAGQTSGEAIYYLERRLRGNRDSLLSERQRTGWVADVGAAGQTDVMEATLRQEVSGRRICVCVCIVATPVLPTTLLSHRARGRSEELDTCKSNTVHQTPQQTEVSVRQTNKPHCFFD